MHAPSVAEGFPQSQKQSPNVLQAAFTLILARIVATEQPKATSHNSRNTAFALVLIHECFTINFSLFNY
jgi:hypothetical protein